MSLTEESDLSEVAVSVAAALRRSKIRAVLTGGACATLHSGGAYQSSDLDFILQSTVTVQRLDAAMGSIGYRRKRDHYEHPSAPFFVEFPPGPLSIGRDLAIKPITYRIGPTSVRILSATDSVRDRLAAFYHWNDPQSLSTALEIALRHNVDMKKIRAWSIEEGSEEGFLRFAEELKRRRM